MTENSTTTGPAFNFDAEALRVYVMSWQERAAALLDRRGPDAKPEDAAELNNLIDKLMSAHYALSAVTGALDVLADLIQKVGERSAAYHVVFGTEACEYYYAPKRTLRFSSCEVDEIPF